jgi:hypothetical protein
MATGIKRRYRGQGLRPLQKQKPTHVHGKKLRVMWEYRNGMNRSFFRTSHRQASSSRRIRKLLMKEQGGKCPGLLRMDGTVLKLCGSICLTDCDHIIELRYRGIDYIGNLQMLCRECHLLKTRLNSLWQSAT